MLYIVVAAIAFCLGAAIPLVLGAKKRKQLALDQARITAEAAEFKGGREKLSASVIAFNKRMTDESSAQTSAIQARQAELAARAEDLANSTAKLQRDQAALDARHVSMVELETENSMLKRDLLNIHTTVRKLQIDRRLQGESLAAFDERASELAERYLADVEKWVAASINANNFAANKQRLQRTIEWCRGIGFEVTTAREEGLLAELKKDYEAEVRKALEREEQARIKAQIREEQQRQKAIDQELQALERERAAVAAALAKALADAKGAHTEEVARLEARLAEAEARNQRAISQAQLTKAGHLYVISNLGSFGEGVFKIGMTRRLDPQERICELGDASVPFPFDVHMMISCCDVPALEKALHQRFHRCRINKVNPRKEYFRADLEEIRAFVESRQGEVRFVPVPEASEYRQSLVVSEEDQEYIERVFEETEKQLGLAEVED